MTGRARDAVTVNNSSPGKITRHFGIATNPTKKRRIPKKKIDVQFGINPLWNRLCDPDKTPIVF